MKNFIKHLVYVSCFLIGAISFAQKLNDSQQTKEVKNEISFEVLQVINGVYQLSYERHIWNNFSATLALGYKSKEGIIALSGIDTKKIKTNNITYDGFQIAPEIRYYLPKTATNKLNGFYLGAYLKYSKYSSELKGGYISSSNDLYDIEFDADINITSIGFMVGYKLPITKHLNIDFMIAGPGTGNYKFKFTNKKDLPDEFYDDFNEALENYDLLDIINSDFRFSKVNKRSDFSTISFRYGIAIGYTF